ncbi:MAG: CDP-glycerol glycerophosphotransferase family protein [Mycetocola reblochoni]|uniref:CDP-glycerol glycerophosphotransferase family protein n=1 Tax=Mycetocola reblochoni TaxID=331618 RepID=UPI003F9C01C5
MSDATNGLPVIHIGDSVDVDRSILPSLHAIVYVNTAVKNAHYIRFTHLRQIQINHGDSDKPASASKAFRMFDVNMVAGQAAVDRFAHYGVRVPRELVRIVGRPQVAAIETAKQSSVDTVLYAPTWAGFFGDSDFSSLRQGEAIVGALLARGKTVIFRPHSFTERNPELAQAAERIRAMLRADSETSHRGHLFGRIAESEMGIVDCFNRSDAMIADVSSIVTDYLYSEKPMAMVSANTDVAAFRESFPVSRSLYVVDQELRNFESVLDELAVTDTGRLARLAARRYYLGEFARRSYASDFVTALREEVFRR